MASTALPFLIEEKHSSGKSVKTKTGWILMSDAMGTRNREELEFHWPDFTTGTKVALQLISISFNTKTPAQLAACWCPLLHNLSPEDHEGAEKRSGRPETAACFREPQ